MFYRCFTYVLYMFYLKTGEKLVKIGFKIGSIAKIQNSAVFFSERSREDVKRIERLLNLKRTGRTLNVS